MINLKNLLQLRFWKIAVILIIAMLLHGAGAYADESKNNLSFLGGITMVSKYGSAENYLPGVNNFPVVPAHHVLSFSLSYARNIWKNVYAEIDFRSFSSAEITMVEPVTNDEVTLDTSKHYAVTANALYRWTKDRFVFYAVAGAGIDRIAKREPQVLQTKMNHEIIIESPEDLTDPVIDAGAGMDVRIWKPLFLRLDFRYFLILSQPDHIGNTAISAGVSYAF